MANSVIISMLNPVRMVPVGTPAYRNFDADWYRNYVLNYQKKDDYFQKWIAGTDIKFQIHANFGPVQFQILDCSGRVLQTYIPNAVATGLYDTGYTTYELSFLPPVMDGTWFVKLTVGSDVTEEVFISEPQITPSRVVNLMTIQYYNSFNHLEVVFKTGIVFNIVVEAIIGPFMPKSKATLWMNQPMDLVKIWAIPYRWFKFILGDSYGVPEWVIEKINGIFCLDNVKLDGVQYTQVDGAEWEPTTLDNYARSGWRVDIQPTKNPTSLRAENGNSPATTFAVVYNIDTRVFGTFNGNVSGNILQVTKLND